MSNPWDNDPVVNAAPWERDPVAGGGKTTGLAERHAAFLRETDRMLGIPEGTSESQIKVESSFNPKAVSRVGAQGLAQVMPATLRSLEGRFKRKLDPMNEDDSLLMHRELMRENLAKFGNLPDALRAYNAGWNKVAWNNPETSAYADKVLGVSPQAKQAQTMSAPARPYQAFAPVPEKVDPATLNANAEWLKASRLVYGLWERKAFEGSDEELAEWGKDSLGYFNFNTVSMAQIAHTVAQGTQEEKEAFLWMMDTYDNTEWSWEGARRAGKGIVTDPLNLVGVGTLGLGFVAKAGAQVAAKQAAKQVILKALGRTGIAAGMEGAIYGAVDSVGKQSVEKSAGRIEEISGTRVAGNAALGAVAGVALGTGADVAAQGASSVAQKIIGWARGRKAAGNSAVAPQSPATAPAAAPTATPSAAQTTPPVAATQAAEAVPANPVANAADNAVADAAPTVEGLPPVEREGNLGATLTDAEREAAAARKQDGRLPEDDVVPVGPNRDVPLELPELNTGLRTTRLATEDIAKVGRAELEELAEPIVKQLRDLSDSDLAGVMEKLRTGRYTLEEARVIARSVQVFRDEISIAKAGAIKARDALAGKKGELSPEDAVKLDELNTRVDALDARERVPGLADDAFGSHVGTMLNDRQAGLPGMKDITVESLMKDRGLTKEQAQTEWAALATEAQRTAEARKVADVWNARSQQALDEGDLLGAFQAASQKHAALNRLSDVAVPGSGGFMRGLKEFAISNVFSPLTVMVNLLPSAIKTLAIPALKALGSDPLSRATRAEMAASYGAMRSSFVGALKAAKMAYKTEQAILTRDGMRLLEGELAITGKYHIGGTIRFIPRLLNATDEFLAKLNYDSFVAGRAAHDAHIEGVAQGLKGPELDDFVKAKVTQAVDDAMAPASGDELLEPLLSKGRNRGFKGDELLQWVEQEAMKDLASLRKGNDEQALEFVKDVLYKRSFTGKGFSSRTAKMYEEWVHKSPSVALVIGQLFFRTPIRVFEEGIRLTPGVQILAPNFLKDLAGNNGTLRQVRAQAEAMTSLAVAGGVLALYAQGRITGEGAYDDYKKAALRKDGSLPEPYSIIMDDGSTWNYRRFDPLATPVKIMVNALERMDKLRVREAQGEFIDKPAYEKPMAALSVATLAIATAIRDASLVEGAEATGKWAMTLANPEEGESAFLKGLGDKLFLLTPNTLHKIARSNDPTVSDPATFWQVVEQKLVKPYELFGASSDIKTSKSYDVLGNVRQQNDTGSMWNVFSLSTAEERTKGLSTEAQEVLAEMDRLHRVTDARFVPPIKHPKLGDTDLRTILASDGKSTLYDVWQRNYAALDPVSTLHPIAVAPLPDGTRKQHGMKAEAMAGAIKKLQEAAFMELMDREERVIEKMMNAAIYKLDARTGKFDTPRAY